MDIGNGTTIRLWKGVLIGALSALLPAIGASWAMGTVAAEYVLRPHIEGAKARIQVMCLVAETQNKKLAAVCKATGAACDMSMDADLIAACREATR